MWHVLIIVFQTTFAQPSTAVIVDESYHTEARCVANFDRVIMNAEEINQKMGINQHLRGYCVHLQH